MPAARIYMVEGKPLTAVQIGARVGRTAEQARKRIAYLVRTGRALTWDAIGKQPRRIPIKPKFTPEERYLTVVGDEWTSPAVVAEALGVSISLARLRLGLLHAEGKLARIKSPYQVEGRKSFLYRRPSP